MAEEESPATSPEKKIDPKAFISIIRPQNLIIGGLTVISGIAIAYKLLPVGGELATYLSLFVLGYFTYFFVGAGGNIVNDIYDIEVDRINRPHRALPSGRMTIKQAWAYTVLVSIIGIILAWFTGPIATIIVIIFEIVGYAYAAKVKALGVAGNFMVSFSFAFGVIYGTLIFHETVGATLFPPIPTWLFFITAFMILQARETIKGAEDVVGDELRDVKTIAREYGYEVAAGVAAALNFIGVLCYILIWLWGFASWDLWWLLLIGVVVVAGAGITPLTGPSDRKRLLVGSTLDKIGALVGLVAFIIIGLYGVVI